MTNNAHRKSLFNSLLTELNEMGLPGMSATLDEMYRAPDFLELDPLMAIVNLVEPEYQKKMNKRIQSRLRAAHLRGGPKSSPIALILRSASICQRYPEACNKALHRGDET